MNLLEVRARFGSRSVPLNDSSQLISTGTGGPQAELFRVLSQINSATFTGELISSLTGDNGLRITPRFSNETAFPSVSDNAVAELVLKSFTFFLNLLSRCILAENSSAMLFLGTSIRTEFLGSFSSLIFARNNDMDERRGAGNTVAVSGIFTG